jgi:hypothetical protein
MEMTQKQYHQWFNSNAFWLREWIKEAIPAVDSNRFDGMQIFKTQIPNIMVTSNYGPFFQGAALEIERNELLKDTMFYHTHTMLKHLVFGIKRRVDRGLFFTNSIGGFLSRKGRLPEPNDVVVLEYMPKRWLKTSLSNNYPTDGNSFFISECRLLIL